MRRSLRRTFFRPETVRPHFPWSILHILWPVNTYPDNFESETFSFRIQKFPRPHVSEFKSNLPVHTKPTRIKIHSSAQDSSGNIGNRACVEVAILNTVITVKNGLDLITSPDKKYPDLASTRFRIHSVLKTFHSRAEGGFKNLQIRMPHSPDTCGRRPYPERKRCGFKNIGIPRVDVAYEQQTYFRSSLRRPEIRLLFAG